MHIKLRDFATANVTSLDKQAPLHMSREVS